jgi:hypothetical protein
MDDIERGELQHRSDNELLSAVGKLIGTQREVTAKLVAYLAEIEERRLHLLAGFSSMFEYCVRELGLSEGEAFRRLVAARLGRRFPVVHALLATARVHLSALAVMRDFLTEENHLALLEAASGKSTREVEALVAQRFPRPDMPSRIRRTRVEPLSETRFKVEFTASAELREKLELCRDLMSHANPERDLAVVVERGLDLLLAKLESERLGRVKRPRKPATALRDPGEGRIQGAKRQAIARATRRDVFERDGQRCTYVAPDGRRCGARAFLELDHAHPRALGGRNDADNLRVRCRAHNQLWAEETYGRKHLDEIRHFRQRKRAGEDDERNRVTARVLAALTGLGFRKDRARSAVAEVRRRHGDGGLPTVEQTLREALAAASVA